MSECPHYENYLNGQKGLEILQTTDFYNNYTYRKSPLPHFMTGKLDDSDTTFNKTSSKLIPPLNTDIRFNRIIPEYQMKSSKTSFTTHFELDVPDDFSWHIPLHSDTVDVIAKKSLINPIQNQHMCGSCWAMALASCISDCHVVAGVVDWMPRIAPTFLMTTVPRSKGNEQCNGGNPAYIALALESMRVADTTCIDYSWCSNEKTCTSADAAQHFKGDVGTVLNKNIPKPSNSCYFDGDRYLYTIDRGTEGLFINDNVSHTDFRRIIKRHILDYGPPLAGYCVLKNFVTGNFTDPNVNDGVYFERANYQSHISENEPLVFDDGNKSEDNLVGLHAVEIVGWGIARNIQYDNDSRGDVPYWWAKNSWGSSWGNMKGYFKMAMYPWNRYSQFGKQVRVKDATVGGMILIKCTSSPIIGKLGRIDESFNTIKRTMPDVYYHKTPNDIKTKHHALNSLTSSSYKTTFIVLTSIGLSIIALYIVMKAFSMIAGL